MTDQACYICAMQRAYSEAPISQIPLCKKCYHLYIDKEPTQKYSKSYEEL